MKTFFSEYIRHCMRFYVRHPKPTFVGMADEENWKACDSVWNNFTAYEQALLTEIYGTNNMLPKVITSTAERHSVSEEKLWALITELEHQVAVRRGLI